VPHRSLFDSPLRFSHLNTQSFIHTGVGGKKVAYRSSEFMNTPLISRSLSLHPASLVQGALPSGGRGCQREVKHYRRFSWGSGSKRPKLEMHQVPTESGYESRILDLDRDRERGISSDKAICVVARRRKSRMLGRLGLATPLQYPLFASEGSFTGMGVLMGCCGAGNDSTVF
jgi:hypothetical protein